MPVIRSALRRARLARRAVRYEALARYRAQPIRAGEVLYESFAGSGALCNPEAIFRELLAASDLPGLRHVWVLAAGAHEDPIVAEFRGDPRVRFVTRDSLPYLRAVSTAEYLVNNATFPHWFAKRPGQVYVNTWHGTPLKTMGNDMPDGGREGGNTLRNFLQADFLLSQNAFMTDTMYASAYRLRGQFAGRVIEEGYPRVDRQDLSAAEHDAVLARLESAGLRVRSRRVVLYAPTWHGDRFADPADDVAALLDRVERLQSLLGEGFAVLLKTHQILERYVSTTAGLAAVLVPSNLPTNLVLGVTDTLITDYSSIFFDFLATGRRIVFHVPDEEEYDAARGRYFGDDALPGPVTADVDDLARMVAAAPDDPRLRADVRDEWQRRFTPHGPGATRRVVDIVFRRDADGHRVRDLSAQEKPSILIHVGNLASNGITASALNLLRALPPERYDVSVAYTRTASRQQAHNAQQIPAHVRQFPRDGGMNGTKWRHVVRRRRYDLRDAAAHSAEPRQRALWDDEWRRCFGSASFDAVVDFSGYSPFWATLLLHSPEARRTIWLHNDMVAEVDRKVGDRRPLATSLPSIAALYPEYDQTVAVSPALASINSTRLPAEVLRGRPIRSALNLIDANRVRRLAAARPFENEPEPEGGRRPDWVRALERHDDAVWFVTVGRYTREKNQDLLVRAFAEVARTDPRVRLLVIGHGPLRDDLEALVDELGLGGIAFITGPLDNPFSVMRSADCFVLSSSYEGQPMVLLEAAVVGLPIISTDFASIRDALPDGMIHIVPSEVAALATGLRLFLEGRVTPSPLDTPTYNALALAQFEAVALGPRPSGSPAPSSTGAQEPTSRVVEIG
ncbi:glycosyltransferase [Frondihabitans australicus]|uniref:CDP-glycerol glycerophosphotransferase (TagB/SpsB family) n=1 Tax=Frondihabitans australicus TaxID=386892 RepID=A0A495IBP0_9MICO|nr:glycosyltransferase [Frondihabitans australicus]RKR73339.1 CDP-glycerol glycerophosphotransferase (TagB/SpsB family) [Frondihabitans australicus]